MPINRSALREHLWPGIAMFFGEYDNRQTQYTDMFDVRQSRKAYEEYGMESFFGLAPEKAEGAPIVMDSAADAWKGRVEMTAFALGFVITREAVNDDQYFDLVPKYSRNLRRSMFITKEVRGAAFLDGVFGTQTTGDGSYVCATDHPLKNGDTFSNETASATDLNETSLEAALIAISNYVDERGLKINTTARRLIVPSALQFTAERIMKTTGARVGTSDNDVAAIHTMGMIPDGYRVNNYLTDPAEWFLKTDVQDGMIHFEREPLGLEEGDGSETQTLKVLAYERYAYACADPRGIYGADGS